MATNFLAASGTNGFLTGAQVTVFSTNSSTGTTIASLATAGTVVSTNTYSQTDTAHGLMGFVQLTSSSTWGPATAGGNFAGWWLQSFDGGTTFETTLTTRGPDFLIPLSTAAFIASPQYVSSPLSPLPWGTFKVLLQNNSGATTPTSGIGLGFQAVAEQY